MKIKWLFLIPIVLGHSNNPATKPAGMSWQDWHMLEEHNVDEYDAITFFKIHDLDGKSTWNKQDILNLYGLARDTIVGDGSGMGDHEHGHEIITEDAKQHVISTILKLIDSDGDGEISAQEFVDYISSGKTLPDFGYGQGHHLDFESEYEEHHWNKYHKDQDPEVLIKHKEDIEHEMLHHEHEIEESHNLSPNIRDITKDYQSPLKIENLPNKFKA
ncbi:protein Ssp120p [[Candida] jaroonii]|uniref:Protein Ssp120p n=1 Tax=[Candida] jaroonii TaxID=467808 RepID=A0ACA9YC49_9ASCO|nr:protein Ssp120p [[Candida] jaroonii]